jgi:hypothetical protein
VCDIAPRDSFSPRRFPPVPGLGANLDRKTAVKIMSKIPQARVTYVVWLLVAGHLIGGCASLNESECRSADWRTIGYEDGARGEPASRIGKHRHACASHGVAPNLTAYQQGREEGLRQFCRPQNGYRLGEQGVPYRGVCPPYLESDFYVAYETGKRIYDVTTRIRHTKKRIRNKEQRRARLEHDRHARQAELLGEAVSPLRRAELLAETIEIVSDESSMEAQIDQLRVELQHQRDFLAELRGNSPYH